MKWPLILIGLTALGGFLALCAGLLWKHKEEVWIGIAVVILMGLTFIMGRAMKVW